MVINHAFIQNVLQQSDILHIIGTRVSLIKKGKNYVGLCPFHVEKTPSFYVNTEKKMYYCFGCHEKGNVLTFVSKIDHLGFVDAVRTVAQQSGIDIMQDTDESYRTIHNVIERVAQSAHSTLKNQPHVYEFLKKRGIKDESIDRFMLGYCVDVPQIDQKELKKAGMLHRYGFLFRHRVTFPIRNSCGMYIGMSGRVVEKEKLPKYINTSENISYKKSSQCYGLYEIDKSETLDHILLVEGPLDMISLSQYKIPAVASMGTALSSMQLKKIFQYTKEIIFCLDGDQAGQKAMQRAFTTSAQVIDATHHVRFIMLPEGVDPDTYVRNGGNMKTLINDAYSFVEFFTYMMQNGMMTTPENKMSLTKEILSHIEEVQSLEIRQELLKRLSSFLNIDIYSLKENIHLSSQAYRKIPIKEYFSVEETLCYYLLQDPDWKDYFSQEVGHLCQSNKYIYLSILATAKNNEEAWVHLSEQYPYFAQRYTVFLQLVSQFTEVSEMRKEVRANIHALQKNA